MATKGQIAGIVIGSILAVIIIIFVILLIIYFTKDEEESEPDPIIIRKDEEEEQTLKTYSWKNYIQEIIIPQMNTQDILFSDAIITDYCHVNDNGDVDIPFLLSSIFSSKVHDIYTYRITFSNFYFQDGNIPSLFQDCDVIESVDLQGLDFTNIVNIDNLFQNCSLEVVDFSNLNLEKINSLYGIFTNCSNLKFVYFNNTNLSGLTLAQSLFSNCTSLSEIEMKNCNMSNVINIDEMFNNCTNLQLVEFDGMDLSKLKSAKYMFNNCISLERKLEDVTGMFSDCKEAKYIYFPLQESFKTMDYLFYNCQKLISNQGGGNSISFQDMELTKLNSCVYMFYNCSSLEKINMQNCNMKNNRDIGYMFGCCQNLYSISLSGCNLSKLIYMDHVFINCTSLTALDLSNMNLSKVINISNIFGMCSNLESIDLNNTDLSGLKDGKYMFSCNKYDGTVYDIIKEYAMKKKVGNTLQENNDEKYNQENNNEKYIQENNDEEIYYLKNIQQINLSNCNLSNLENMSQMFFGCTSLEKLDLSHLNLRKVQYVDYIFWNCNKLKYLDMSYTNLSSLKDIIEYKAENGNIVISPLQYFCNKSLIYWDLSYTNLSGLSSLESFFQGNNNQIQGLQNLVGEYDGVNFYINFDNCNLSNIENANYMFKDCTSLVNFSFNAIMKPKTAKGMFQNCINMKQLEIEHLKLRNCENIEDLFDQCNSLSKLSLNNQPLLTIANISFEIQNSQLIIYGDNCQYNYLQNTVLEADNKEITFYEILPWEDIDQYIVDGKLTINNKNIQNPQGNILNQIGITEVEITECIFSQVNDDLGVSIAALFSYCTKLQKVVLNGINTTGIYSMNAIFSQCYSLKEVYIVSFDFSQINDIDQMFYKCNQLETIVLDNSNYTLKNGLLIIQGDQTNYSFSNYIASRSQLNEDIVKFQLVSQQQEGITQQQMDWQDILQLISKQSTTGHVTLNNNTLTFFKLDISNYSSQISLSQYINPTNITKVVFDQCNFIETNIQGLFANCINLIEINLENLEQVNPFQDISQLYSNCINLQKINMFNFDFSNVINMKEMFLECKNLNEFSITNNTGHFSLDHNQLIIFNQIDDNQYSYIYQYKLVNINKCYINNNYCFNIVFFDKIDLEDTINLINNGKLILKDLEINSNGNSFPSELQQVEFDNVIFSNQYSLQTTFAHLFENTSIEYVDMGGILNQDLIENMNYMFNNCQNLLEIYNLQTDSVKSMKGMFSNSGIKEINDLGKLTNVEDMSEMFLSCYFLQTCNILVNGYGSSLKDISRMFFNCKQLLQIRIDNVNILQIESMDQFIDGCIGAIKLCYNNNYPDTGKTGSALISSNNNYQLQINYKFNIEGDKIKGYETYTASNVYINIDYCEKVQLMKSHLLQTSSQNQAYFYQQLNWSDLVDYLVNDYEGEYFTNLYENNIIKGYILENGNLKKMDGGIVLKNFMLVGYSNTIKLSDYLQKNIISITMNDIFISGDDISGMFSNCKYLQNIDIQSINTNATIINQMFLNCSSLETLASGINLEKVEQMNDFLKNCPKLTYLKINNSQEIDEGESIDKIQLVYKNGIYIDNNLYYKNGNQGIIQTGNIYQYKLCKQVPWSDILIDGLLQNDDEDTPIIIINYEQLTINFDKIYIYDAIFADDNLNGMFQGSSASEIYLDTDLNGKSIKNILHDCQNLWIFQTRNSNQFTIDLDKKRITIPNQGEYTEKYVYSSYNSNVIHMNKAWGVKFYKNITWNNLLKNELKLNSGKYEIIGWNILEYDSQNKIYDKIKSQLSAVILLNSIFQQNTMTGLFDDCINLSKVDVSNQFTDNITDMSYLFNDCSYMSDLNLVGWNFSNITNMENFANGMNLKTLSYDEIELVDDEEKDKHAVINGYQFPQIVDSIKQNSNYYTVTFQKSDWTWEDVLGYVEQKINSSEKGISEISIKIKGKNINYQVQNTRLYTKLNAFSGKVSLTFYQCNFVNSSLDYMFDQCNNLQKLDISTCNLENITDIKYLFGKNQSIYQGLQFLVNDSLVSIDQGKLYLQQSNTGYYAKQINNGYQLYNYIFQGKSDQVVFTVEGIADVNVIWSELVEFIKGNVDKESQLVLKNMNIVDYDDQQEYKNSSDIGKINTSFQDNFYKHSLDIFTSITIDSCKINSVIGLFKDLSKLISVDISKMDMSNINNISYMFYNCDNITSIIFPDNLIKLNQAEMAFLCDKLEEITMNIESIENTNNMFYNCPSLQKINMDNLVRINNAEDFYSNGKSDQGNINLVINMNSLKYLDYINNFVYSQYQGKVTLNVQNLEYVSIDIGAFGVNQLQFTNNKGLINTIDGYLAFRAFRLEDELKPQYKYYYQLGFKEQDGVYIYENNNVELIEIKNNSINYN